MALESDDPVAALQFWTEAVARYPNFAKGSPHALTILLGLKLFDEAEALMREGQKSAPRDPYYADGLARVAERRGDTEDAFLSGTGAEEVPDLLERLCPGRVRLVKVGRLDEAEVLIEKAVKRFPD